MLDLPEFLANGKNEPQSINDQVTEVKESLNEKIDAALRQDNDLVASITRVQGAIILSQMRTEHSDNRLLRKQVDRWIYSHLPKVEAGHVKRALDTPDDEDADQSENASTEDVASDGDEEFLIDDVTPSRDLDSLTGDDLRARLYTRVVSRIMAAYEADANIPVYEQDNENAGSYLFHGIPGTGKTHAAEAVAFALQALGYDTGFYPTTGSQIKSSDYGESEKRLERLLRQADNDNNQVSVVFFDEFEDIATRSEHHATAAIANTLQSLTSGADAVESVVVIGATNYSQRISDAIHSRFTRVEFQEPTRRAKFQMLEHYLGEARSFEPEALKTLDPELFDGLTGRDMKLTARAAVDRSLLPDGSQRPTCLEDMKSVRNSLSETPSVSLSDVERALVARQ